MVICDRRKESDRFRVGNLVEAEVRNLECFRRDPVAVLHSVARIISDRYVRIRMST